MKYCNSLIALALVLAMLAGCSAPIPETRSGSAASSGEAWSMGYGSAEIVLPKEGDLYIAGYKNGVEITDIRDVPRVSAVWLGAGEGATLLLSVDCIALASDTVAAIREALAELCTAHACAAVNVVATHTHAGIDTLGLWGPVGTDGKNPAYMANLITAAVAAAEAAVADRSEGALYYGEVNTSAVQYDSREPQHMDGTLRQLRFESADGRKNGIRILSYAAHAESLRGANTRLSRDYPGVLADNITDATGDDVIFLPASIGGLIMTRDLCTGLFDEEKNLLETGRLLAEYLLSIREERELSPAFTYAYTEWDTPLHNTLFLYYKALGILGNRIYDGESESGYVVRSEVGALTLGDVTLLFIPGELFPELESGEHLGKEDPPSLHSIAEAAGVKTLLTVNVANDELGYIVPPSDFKVHPDLPYIQPLDGGENHYEETNSVGPYVAEDIAEAVRTVLGVWMDG